MGKGISKAIERIEGIGANQVVGNLDASGMRFGIIVARFNDELTDELARSAYQCLEKNGAKRETIDMVRVPGAYEIPVVAEKMAASGNYNALIVLGVVVEGETQHAQMIIDTTGQSILDIACRHQLPVINEIVGVRSWAQAEARCLGGENTRGWYAAEAAIETARVYKQIG
ncbi:6,7-dimethyl-8-ribityllumazine synthase [Pontiella sulfatireligans]|uniref:6,7-dimethyl-8-ribityllumazine synthase n=1 Tax=Pontiella sulfatireligans TaxID=2750658 RepID=A0A6C2UL45_9BACT|nr:6,7-dimethyl-8-ribityllumazine synthase [Pontiella sulfatireligans]VGO20950.1 6,7-dimethyl-8-ribityllumazine synthase [Pontiella sulfatireligans]